MALEIPELFFWSFFFVKKLTVNGIIGNTQGVKRANKPPRKPRTKIFQRDFSPFTSPTTDIYSFSHFKSDFVMSLGDNPYNMLFVSSSLISALSIIVSWPILVPVEDRLN